jgi:signal transduction histidine kinase
MALGKRGYAALTALLVGALMAVVVGDIYVDWVVDGKPLWSTVVENVTPLALGAVVLLASAVAYRGQSERFFARVSRWQYLGAAGVAAVVAWVVGLQVLQGELKPFLVVLQTALGGALAGTVVGFASAQADRTRRAVERERDRFEALYENAPAETVDTRLVDGEVTVRRVNTAFEETFDTGEGAVRGRALFDLVDHGDADRETIRAAIETDESAELETETPTAEGRRFFQLRVAPYAADCAYLIYTDVTELRGMRQEMEETLQELERSNERLQQFAYVVSHDLQEPLRMVSSYVDLLGMEYEGELDEEADEYIGYAVDGAERMQDMIDALLDYSRVRTQGEAFDEVDADEVFTQARQSLELLIAERDATVTADDLPTVEADGNQLGQLFQNLVENAIEHGGEAPSVHVSGERRDGEVVFSVADDGPGIPEEKQEEVFELFVQGDAESEGTGMGLAICERIVDRHDGELWVESSPGEGATFHVSIPA